MINIKKYFFMEEIYCELFESFPYDRIHMKDKYILLDLGVINNDSYHIEITEKTLSFFNINNRLIQEYEHQDTKDINKLIDEFIEITNSKPITNNESLDNFDINEYINSIETIDIYNSNICIYTYGCKNFNPEGLYIEHHFDVSKYNSYIPASFGSIRYLTGKNEIVHKMIAMSEQFVPTLQNMIKTIETKKYKSIAIFCSHGKHRSVSFAEILKQYFYKNAIIKHQCIS
jgi:RNase adaptor protein for sRNA GlmZ degradation